MGTYNKPYTTEYLTKLNELAIEASEAGSLLAEMAKKIDADLLIKRENIIKAMLIKKGYSEFVNINERVRFPKINSTRSIDGWEYIFVDNGTKQGDFIVAIGPLKYNHEYNYAKLDIGSVSCDAVCSFEWQDTNFDAVRL